MIDIDDKLPENIILKNAAVLMTSVINNDDKFYWKLFLEETLYDK